MEGKHKQGMPVWVYIFFVLYLGNFLFIIGGAIGGALNALFAHRSGSIASNYEKKTIVRVLSCLGLWVASVIIEIILAVLLNRFF